jgi:hypothetical protein
VAPGEVKDKVEADIASIMHDLDKGVYIAREPVLQLLGEFIQNISDSQCIEHNDWLTYRDCCDRFDEGVDRFRKQPTHIERPLQPGTVDGSGLTFCRNDVNALQSVVSRHEAMVSGKTGAYCGLCFDFVLWGKLNERPEPPEYIDLEHLRLIRTFKR